MAVLRALSGRGGLRGLCGDAPPLLGGAEEAPPGPGQEAGGGPGLVQKAGPSGHDALRERLCRGFKRREGEAGLSPGMRRELPAPDAPAGEPQGPQRRGLRRQRFSEGPAVSWDHGGFGGPGGRLPPPGDEPVPGFCDEPHQRGPRLGEAGPGGGSGIPGPLFLLRLLGHPPGV